MVLTPEIISLIAAGVGSLLTWIAARKGWIKPATPANPNQPSPVPVPGPVAPSLPIIPDLSNRPLLALLLRLLTGQLTSEEKQTIQTLSAHVSKEEKPPM